DRLDPDGPKSMEIQLALNDDDPAAIVLRQIGQPIEGARAPARNAPEDLAVAERPKLVVEDPAFGVPVAEHDGVAGPCSGAEQAGDPCFWEGPPLLAPRRPPAR